MKADLNTKNDKMLRAGASALYKEQKLKKCKREMLKDEETKAKTLEFIFGKSDENPLESIKRK